MRLLACYRNQFDNCKILIHSQDVDLLEKIKAELQLYSTEEACAQLVKEIDCHLEELVKSKNENDLKIKSERIQIFIKSINDLAVSDFSKENSGIYKNMLNQFEYLDPENKTKFKEKLELLAKIAEYDHDYDICIKEIESMLGLSMSDIPKIKRFMQKITSLIDKMKSCTGLMTLENFNLDEIKGI